MLPSFSKRLFFGIFFLLLLILAAFYKPESPSPKASETKKETKGLEATPTPAVSTIPRKDLYPVIKAVDGDTIAVQMGEGQETLRLIGINTPESVDPRRPVECFAREASQKAKDLLFGKLVSLEADATQGERDKYQRLLRYVFLADGTNFNKLMILEGYAYEYTYNLPYKYQKEFKNAEMLARQGKKGLWADNACSVNVQATPAANETPPSGSYSCDCNKTCSQIKSCSEANYQFSICKCTQRDSDGDGVPCEALCR